MVEHLVHLGEELLLLEACQLVLMALLLAMDISLVAWHLVACHDGEDA